MSTILSPREKTKQLKKRIEAFKPQLPRFWITLFKHDNPEYAKKDTLLKNTAAGRSHSEKVITDIEEWLSKQAQKNA